MERSVLNQWIARYSMAKRVSTGNGFSMKAGPCIVAIAACILLIPAVSSNADVWTGLGADDLWTTVDNWNDNELPSASDTYVGNGSSSSNPATINSTVAINRLWIGQNASGDAESGYVTVTTGSDFSTANQLRVGHVAGSYGELNIEGGAVRVATGNSNAAWIIGASGTGAVNITGGSFTGQGGSDETLLGTGSGTGIMTVSDAAVVTLNESFTVGGGAGSGTLVLDGSITAGGSDFVNNRGGNNRIQFLNNSTFRAIIDQAAIDDPGVMRQILFTSSQNSNSNILFDDGSLLDLKFASGVTPTPGTWTLVTTAAGLTDNGLALGPGVDSGWSFSTANKMLTVTFIPEPGTIALLAAGAALILPLRRKKS